MSDDPKQIPGEPPHWHQHPHFHQGTHQRPHPESTGQMPPEHPGYEHHAAHHMGYPPPPPYYGHPGYAPHYGYPGHYHPAMMPPPSPNWPGYQPEMPQQASNPLIEQAQAVLEGAMGEEAGMFKDMLNTLGMSDKEFWKGAMVGAAAVLLFSNENVRGKLLELVAGASGMMNSEAANNQENTE